MLSPEPASHPFPQMTNDGHSPMRIRLSEERREEFITDVVGMFSQEFDEELSRFRAEQLLDFFVKTLGPSVYNQAIQDARKFVADRLEDLDATFYEEGG